jgi:hypothetical protein
VRGTRALRPVKRPFPFRSLPAAEGEEKKKKGFETTYLVRVGAQRNAKRAGEPKISQLQVVPLVYEEVLWLEVAMQDPVRVAVQQPRGQLVCEFLRNVATIIIITKTK